MQLAHALGANHELQLAPLDIKYINSDKDSVVPRARLSSIAPRESSPAAISCCDGSTVAPVIVRTSVIT